MKGFIYIIRTHQSDDVYYGSTIETLLCKRMAKHRCQYKRCLNGKSNYTSSHDILKYEDAYIELVEEIEFQNKQELHTREGHYIRENKCVNKRIAGRTEKQYYQDNKEVFIKKSKQHYEANKTEIAEKSKQHYEANKTEIAEKSKQYYEANKTELLEKQKQYMDANKDKILEYQKQYNNSHKEHKKQYDKAYRASKLLKNVKEVVPDVVIA